MRLEQVGLRVSDLDRSLRFYTRGLGLREVRRGDTRSWGGGIWVLLRDPRSRRVVELNWYPKGSRFAPPYRAGEALDHLDFGVGAVPRKVLAATGQRLLRYGARPTEFTVDTTEGWMTTVLDPDGIWITIGRRPTAAERRKMAAAPAARRRRRGGTGSRRRR